HSGMNFSFSVINKYLCVLFLLAAGAFNASARVVYGLNVSEELLQKKAQQKLYEMLGSTKNSSKEIIVAVEKPHFFDDQTGTFFLILALIAAVAFFRQSNPIYFRNLFRAFRNPTLSARQLREPLEQNNIANLTLDLIFSFSLAFYLYFALRYLFPSIPLLQKGQLSTVGLLVVGILLIYFLRFVCLRFTGWVFGIPEIMEHYAFNIRLINKVEGILLIPFTIILAFGEGTWVQAALFISLVIIL